jgi:hypothetical protein
VFGATRRREAAATHLLHGGVDPQEVHKFLKSGGSFQSKNSETPRNSGGEDHIRDPPAGRSTRRRVGRAC